MQCQVQAGMRLHADNTVSAHILLQLSLKQCWVQSPNDAVPTFLRPASASSAAVLGCRQPLKGGQTRLSTCQQEVAHSMVQYCIMQLLMMQELPQALHHVVKKPDDIHTPGTTSIS